MVEWNSAQHIYCSPHPVQFPRDTDSLVATQSGAQGAGYRFWHVTGHAVPHSVYS